MMLKPAYRCRECDAEFATREEMDPLHKEMPPWMLEQETRCEVCNVAFPSRALLRDHFRRIHPGMPQTFCCDVCGAEFRIASALKAHEEGCRV